MDLNILLTGLILYFLFYLTAKREEKYCGLYLVKFFDNLKVVLYSDTRLAKTIFKIGLSCFAKKC